MKTTTKKICVAFAFALVITNINAQDANPENPDPPSYDPGNPNYWHVQSTPCEPSATSWVLGGNNMLPYGPFSDIGTCNNYPFILKSNNRKSVYITQNGLIGVNEAGPSAALDVREPGQVAPNFSNFRIYGDLHGNLESTTDINMNFGTGKIFNINEGPANSGVNVMSIVGGNVGIGTSNPSSKLEVRDASNVNVYASSTNVAGTAGFWALNGSIYNYGFRMDAAGIGHISQFVNSPANLINFNYNTLLSKPQVWVGKRPTQGAHTDFNFAAPKIVAEEIYVFTTTGYWADFVFAKDYKLPKLSDVESYYKKNHHLPEIPSSAEVESKGINVAEMNKLLLQKVEELTIYLVEQQKEIEKLKEKIK